MARLILIRHGECLGQGAYIGRRTDPPLSGQGRENVLKLKASLVNKGIIPADYAVSFYNSPLLRATETAEILCGGRNCGDRIRTLPELAEIDFGLWDGLSWDEISSNSPGEYQSWVDDPLHSSPPEGESLIDFSRRVELAIEKILNEQSRLEPDGLDAVIITHGGVIRSLVCLMLGLPAQSHWSFGVSCASFSIMQIFPKGSEFQGAILECLNCR